MALLPSDHPLFGICAPCFLVSSHLTWSSPFHAYIIPFSSVSNSYLCGSCRLGSYIISLCNVIKCGFLYFWLVTYFVPMGGYLSSVLLVFSSVRSILTVGESRHTFDSYSCNHNQRILFGPGC